MQVLLTLVWTAGCLGASPATASTLPGGTTRAEITREPPLTRQTRQLRAVDVVCAIDDSGSEFGWGGTDPFALRYRACSLAASYLSSIATSGLNHRFGVVAFGTSARARTAGLVQLPGGLGDVDNALRDPTDLGDTDYAAGIRAAAAMLGPADPERRRVILVMGDGIPDVRGNSLDEAFADIRSAVAASPADVLVFQADPSGRAPDLEQRWAQQGVSAVQRIASLDDGSLERSYVDALRRAVGMDRGDEIRLTESDPVASIDVPNYLEALTVTWFAPGDMGLQVAPSGGGDPVPVTGGPVGARTFRLPAGGRWQVRLVKGSSALVAVDLVPVAATVLAPGVGAPQGRDLTVEASFATTAGEAVADVASDPRYFGAVVTDPGGRASPLELRRDVRGRYRATTTVRLDEPGAWRVDLVMKSRDGNVVGTAGAAFTVTPSPWLSVEAGGVRSREPMTVPITLHSGTRTVAADAAFSEDPQAAVLASLIDADGNVRETTRARWVGDSRFVARFVARFHDGDRTWVRVELASVDRSAHPVADMVEAEVIANPTSAMLWAQRLQVALWALLGTALCGLIVYGGWLMARPALHGRIDLSAHGGPAVMRLDGGRWRRVDGRGRRSVWVWSRRDGAIHRNVGPAPWPHNAATVPATRRPTTTRVPTRDTVSARS